MIMLNADGEVIHQGPVPFRAKTFITNQRSLKMIRGQIYNAFREQENHIEEFSNEGSNWVFDYGICFEAEISHIKPLSGGARLKQIKNAHFLTDVISKKEKDNFCFLYAVCAFLWGAFLSPQERIKAESYKRCLNKFNLSNLNFPMKINEIEKFAKQNEKWNLKFNVLFRTSDDHVYPLLIGIGEGSKVINLLLVETLKDTNYHYVLIDDINKFLRKSYPKYDKKSYKNQFFCLNCLNWFSTKQILNKHMANCLHHKTRSETATQDPVRFFNYEKQFPAPLVGYLDFECCIENINQTPPCKNCTTLRCKCDCSYTFEYSKHSPCAYSFVIVNIENDIIFQTSYTGQNAAKHFLDMLLHEEKVWIKKLLFMKKEMKELTEKEKLNFKNAKTCHICDQPFYLEQKCRDHDHYSGQYLGASHNLCNIKRTREKNIQIFIHNAARYDMHLIINALNDKVNNLEILPFNNEQYRILSFNSFKICDSIHFLQNSLAALAANLFESGHKYKVI